MQLSRKAVRFIVDALDHYQQFQNQRLQLPELSEDEISDITNDQHFLEEIKQDLIQHQSEPIEVGTAAGISS